MLIIILNIFLFIILLLLIFTYTMFWPPDSPWAPWWRTNEKAADAICKLAKINNKDLVYDLGCGDGVLVNVAAKKYGAKAVGIEIDLTRYFFAKIRTMLNKLSKQVKIKKNNFFKESLTGATIIVVYLVPKTLERLRIKFLKELKPGTRIVSYRYEINLPLVAYDKENDVRVYKIPKNI
jgi:16S rRNA A1518/A1519 N6-dimethyltransferase RsmA/KsgA/DIM1 with predicted DNA glycosylase/AP lyase activity